MLEDGTSSKGSKQRDKIRTNNGDYLLDTHGISHFVLLRVEQGSTVLSKRFSSKQYVV